MTVYQEFAQNGRKVYQVRFMTDEARSTRSKSKDQRIEVRNATLSMR